MWDSGQFHHAGGRVLAVLDLELGHLGDPMMDLAGWRMRDTIVGYGDFPELYDRYAELTGDARRPRARSGSTTSRSRSPTSSRSVRRSGRPDPSPT